MDGNPKPIHPNYILPIKYCQTYTNLKYLCSLASSRNAQTQQITPFAFGTELK